jgi:N-acetylmuramoyl-L-alanine amidase
MRPFSTHSPKPKRASRNMAIKHEIISHPSPNFDERKGVINHVMLHYTGMKSQEAALRLLSDPDPRRINYQNEIVQTPKPNNNSTIETPAPSQNLFRVSAHYVVYDDGQIFQLVDEVKRAWHAGAGNYAGITDMNSHSIGIEIANGGHDFGIPEFPQIQIDAVMWLVEQIKLRHGLDKHAIIGHSDYAPKRKLDPGERFPWQDFANRGISLSIPKGKEDGFFTILASENGQSNDYVARAKKGLRIIGYFVDDTDIYDLEFIPTLIAFQRRFRQSDVMGLLDVDTLGKIERLAKILSPS